MYKLMRHALVLWTLAVVSVESAHAAPSYPWPAYSVVPVFFVPKDWDVNSSEVQAEAAALRSALVEVRQFYAHVGVRAGATESAAGRSRRQL
jgi:hypothetical protein